MDVSNVTANTTLIDRHGKLEAVPAVPLTPAGPDGAAAVSTEGSHVATSNQTNTTPPNRFMRKGACQFSVPSAPPDSMISVATIEPRMPCTPSHFLRVSITKQPPR